MWYWLRLLAFFIIAFLMLPILQAVGVALLALNLFAILAAFARRQPAPDRPPASGLASIIVLNWNGKELLAEGIPSILKAVEQDGRAHEVIVVDNGSTDGSLDFLSNNFPQVRVLPLKHNVGFAEGNNQGVRAARNDIVILLNSDMVVDPGFISPLLKGFGPSIFAVSSQIFLQDPSKRREETGKTAAVFRRGMIDYTHRDIGPVPPRRDYYPVLWAGGGSSAFCRHKFLALGGFKRLYSPAYVEDADLSFQAWQVGWDVLLAPKSIVYHKHRASSEKRFSPSALQKLVIRNQYLFIWKNIRSWKLLLSHCGFLAWNCFRLSRDHGIAAWGGFFGAVAAIPAVAVSRPGLPFKQKRADRTIFELFSKPGSYFSMQRSNKKLQAQHAGIKPRVLWITAYLPHTGRHAGAGRMFQLLKRLSANYRITLLTFLETDDEKLLLAEVEQFCDKVVALRRTRPQYWNLFAYEPFDEFLTPEMEQAVDQCLEETDFDLIQLEYTQMASYAKRAPGIQSILTKHEVDFAACLRRARRESNPATRFRWFYNYLQVLDREIRLTKMATASICMTDTDARELHKFCASVTTYVINTGVDLDYFEPPGMPAVKPKLVFVGAFQHLPNVESMTYFCRDILPLVRQEMPEVELYIVGSHPSPAVISLSSIPGVQVTGYVPDIRPYMAECSVYIVPLRLGVGIRGKILEAWSMKMPVVSTSVGCAGLRCENNRNLLIADTSEQFASAVLSLLKNSSLRRRLGEEGRKTVDQYYGWEKSARELDAVYRYYLSRRQPNAGRAAE